MAVLVVGAVAGCSAPAKKSDAGLVLQSQVLAVTEAAAADDQVSALRLLDELEAKLDQAAAAGDMSFTRHQSIMATINALRTEMAARPLPGEAAIVADQAPLEQVAPAAVAAAPAVQAPVPAAPVAPPAVSPPVAQAPMMAAPAPAPPVNGKGLGRLKGNGKGSNKG